jgi:hypothetical protein
MAYVIKPGDTLSGIAKANNTDINTLLGLNPHITDPNLIRSGASLNLPQVSTPAPAPTQTTPAAPVDNTRQIIQDAGQAGIDLKDLPSLISTTPEQTQSIRDELAKQYGYGSFDEFTRDIFTKPSKTTEQLYNDAYNAAGLPDLLNKLATAKNNLNTATGNINENPWLDEASRVGRVKRLQELAQGDIANLENEYNLRLNQVHNLVQQHSQDLTDNEKLNEARLNFLLKQAEEKAQQQKASTIQSYLPDYFAKTQSNQKPVSVELNEGNALYVWNPDTKQFELQAQKPKTYKPASTSSRSTSAPTTSSRTTSTPIKAAFTPAQINKGAAVAMIPIDDFKRLEPDTQNFFINRSADIQQKYKLIDEAAANNEDPSTLEAEISNGNAPAAVKDSLVRYLYSKLPRSQQKKGFFQTLIGR